MTTSVDWPPGEASSPDPADFSSDPIDLAQDHRKLMADIHWEGDRTYKSKEDIAQDIWVKVMAEARHSPHVPGYLHSVIGNQQKRRKNISQMISNTMRYFGRKGRDYQNEVPLASGEDYEEDSEGRMLHQTPAEPPPGIEADYILGELTHEVEAALNQLPPDQFQVLQFRYFSDPALSRTDVARKMNLPNNYEVKVLEQAALRSLANLLAHWNDNAPLDGARPAPWEF
jgi:DNA-directed RNA polymerase specialized sigma24 family protein